MDAAKLFNEHFSNLLDKSGAWQDLVGLAYDEEKSVRLIAAEALVYAFIHVPDKTQAGHDLHGLIQDEKSYRDFREAYARGLKEIFSLIPDKEMAWQDLHKLTKDDSFEVRLMAINAIGEFFSQIPNKDEACQDLRRLLVKHEDFRELGIVARTIVKIFSDLPYKDQVWQDFVAMAKNWGGGRDARNTAARSLVSVFAHVPDKDQAWKDLIKISSIGGSGGNQSIVAQALGSAFAYVSDKEQAWQDLVELTGNEYVFVRSYAAKALGTAFIHVRDKSEAWSILHRLAYDTDDNVRSSIAYTIGSVFSYIPDKDEAWEDLVNLSLDKNNVVRMNAYHSLGRVSIFKATTAKDNDTLKRNLEDAINYFDKSSYDSDNSPSKFCYPFYRSYYAITFQDAKENEVHRYLAEAKKAVGGSKSKDELLLAVENLVQALQESQRLKGRSLEEIAGELNAYRWYCEKAASYMDAAEDKAPGAVNLMRMGNPFLEEKILATIAEIQKKARQICQITRDSGTVYEAPVIEINRASKALSFEDISQDTRSVIRIISQLKELCRILPNNNKRELADEAVAEAELAPEFPDKLDKIELAIAYVSSAVESALQSEDVRLDIKQVLIRLDAVNNKLDEIRYSVFKMRISSGNIISNLDSIRSELEKIHQLSQQYPESSLRVLYSCQEDKPDELGRDLEKRFDELNEILKEKASKDDMIRLEQIKPQETWRSKIWDKADKGATLLTYISFLTESITVLSTAIG